MKYRAITELDVVVPSEPEAYTNYKYWARNPEAKTEQCFNMLIRFSDTMYLLTKVMKLDEDTLEQFISNIDIDSHFDFDIINIMKTPDIDNPINFKDTLTIFCAMIVRFYHWRQDNKLPSVYDICKTYVTTPFENHVIGRLYNQKLYFDDLFIACHVHLYNLANKKVSDIPESGTKVCEYIKTIFN